MKRLLLGSAILVLLFAIAGIAGAHEASAPAAAKQKVRFAGAAKNGQPISFRVVTKGGKSRIKGLAVDVVTECWADLNADGVEDKIVAHITNLNGKVSRSGEVEVYYAPDDDTEYIVEGTLVNRVAKLNVIVGGRFGPDGIPNAGNLECDNWGTRYKAKARG
jgi:hypothetical protein